MVDSTHVLHLAVAVTGGVIFGVLRCGVPLVAHHRCIGPCWYGLLILLIVGKDRLLAAVIAVVGIALSLLMT